MLPQMSLEFSKKSSKDLILYHGSYNKIVTPCFGGKAKHDYGNGFI